jgi:hypothetical protein
MSTDPSTVRLLVRFLLLALANRVRELGVWARWCRLIERGWTLLPLSHSYSRAHHRLRPTRGRWRAIGNCWIRVVAACVCASILIGCGRLLRRQSGSKPAVSR